jgi:hypothetical protein
MKAYKKYFTTVGLIWAACFVVFCFAYLLIMSPQHNIIKPIDSKLAEKEQRYESIVKAAREENVARVKEDIERLRSKVDEFAANIEYAGNLTFDISRIAGEKKVTAFSIKGKGANVVSEISDCKYIGENRIEISFISGFNEFATFLNALERHRPVVFVNGFTLNQARQGGTGYQVSMNVAVLVIKP